MYYKYIFCIMIFGIALVERYITPECQTFFLIGISKHIKVNVLPGKVGASA